MSSQLTGGAPIGIQLAEELIDRLVANAYFNSPDFPKQLTGEIAQGNINGDYAISLLVPSAVLHFDAAGEGAAVIRLTIPIAGTLRAEAEAFGLDGRQQHRLDGSSLQIDVPLQIGPAATDSERAPTLAITPSLAGANVKATCPQVDPNARAGIELLLQVGVVTSRTMLPPMTFPMPRRFFDYSIEAVTSPDPDAPVDLQLFLGERRGLFASSRPPCLVTSADELMVALSPEEFASRISSAIRRQFGDLPAKLPDDDSVTLRSISLELQEGYVDMHGSAAKEVWGIGADVDFSGKIRFDGVNARLDDEDADLPWWLDAIGFLYPLGGTFFWLREQAIADGAVGEVPDQFSRAIFDAARGMALRRIEPRRNGLLLFGTYSTYGFVGNRRSKELHLPTDRHWIDQMSGKNVVWFERWQDAIAEGYNGCAFCIPQLNTG